MTVSDVIREIIRRQGPIPFDQFMDLALYYPDLGYYNSHRNPIGPKGDYYTMPQLTPVIGVMIARQLKEMWEILGHPEKFTVLEIGAGNGQLCRSIVREAKKNQDFENALEYRIVERSAMMRVREKEILPSSVYISDSLDALPPFTGCVLSNEFFDNLPFSIFAMEKELMEVWVGHDLNFFEVLKPASDRIKSLIESLDIRIPEKSRLEISEKSFEYLHQIALKLQKGFVLTTDYGYLNPELFRDQDTSGTLTCYHGHRRNQNPYIHVGEQDITAHVNFSTLSQFGRSHGLQVAGYTCQANFLRAWGLLSYLSEAEPGCSFDESTALRFVTDLLFNKTGNKFKTLIQYKGIPPPLLTGLVFRTLIRL